MLLYTSMNTIPTTSYKSCGTTDCLAYPTTTSNTFFTTTFYLGNVAIFCIRFIIEESERYNIFDSSILQFFFYRNQIIKARLLPISAFIRTFAQYFNLGLQLVSKKKQMLTDC